MLDQLLVLAARGLLWLRYRISGIVRAAREGQLRTLRIAVTGALKALLAEDVRPPAHHLGVDAPVARPR